MSGPSRTQLVAICLASSLFPCVAAAQEGAEPTASVEKHVAKATAEQALEFLSQFYTMSESVSEIRGLVKRLGDDRFRTRESAEFKLTCIGQAVSTEVQKATTSKDPEVSIRAKRVLARLNNNRWLEATTSTALRIVSKTKQPNALNVLLRFLPYARSHSVRVAAMKALRSVTLPTHQEVLRTALRHDNSNVRAAAAYALESLLSSEQIVELKFLLDDEDDWVRVVTAQAITHKGDRRALRTLVDLMSSDKGLVRGSSASILRDCSGKTFGFSTVGDEEARHKAIAAWTKWIDEHPNIALKSPTSDIVMSPNLLNSTWRIRYDLPDSGKKEHNIVFQPEGFLQVRGGGDSTKDDSWTATDMTVSLKFNNNYVEYTGMLMDYDTMSGEALNIKGVKWTWEATRVR